MKLAFLLLLATALVAFAADAAGKWTATFDTQIGVQDYTYDFKVAGNVLTGKATKKGSEPTEIVDGKVDGNTISFVENLNFDGNAIRIEYSGKFEGDDKIHFTRKVADFGVEEIVANRVK